MEKLCKINNNTTKRMKAAYYEKFSQEEHISVFVKRLNDEQYDLTDARIVMTDKYKL